MVCKLSRQDEGRIQTDICLGIVGELTRIIDRGIGTTGRRVVDHTGDQARTAKPLVEIEVSVVFLSGVIGERRVAGQTAETATVIVPTKVRKLDPTLGIVAEVGFQLAFKIYLIDQVAGVAHTLDGVLIPAFILLFPLAVDPVTQTVGEWTRNSRLQQGVAVIADRAAHFCAEIVGGTL